MVNGTDSPVEGSDGQADSGRDGEPQVIKTTIDTDPTTAEYAFLEVIAEVEGVEMDHLPSLYDQVDHLIERLFKQPPAPEAQVELSFSYAGHRVRLTQGGQLTVLNVKDSIEGR